MATTKLLLALAEREADEARLAWALADKRAGNFSSAPLLAEMAERRWATYLLRLAAVKALTIRASDEHAAAHGN